MTAIMIITNQHRTRLTSRVKVSKIQRAKKVVSDSPGLVDFAIGQVNSVLNLQWRFIGELKLQKYCKTKCFKFLINSCRPKVTPTKWNLHKQDEVLHYMSDKTYWDSAHIVKADVEKNFGGKCCPWLILTDSENAICLNFLHNHLWGT